MSKQAYILSANIIICSYHHCALWRSFKYFGESQPITPQRKLRIQMNSSYIKTCEKNSLSSHSCLYWCILRNNISSHKQLAISFLLFDENLLFWTSYHLTATSKLPPFMLIGWHYNKMGRTQNCLACIILLAFICQTIAKEEISLEKRTSPNHSIKYALLHYS